MIEKTALKIWSPFWYQAQKDFCPLCACLIRLKETSSQSETIPNPQLPLMEVTIQKRIS